MFLGLRVGNDPFELVLKGLDVFGCVTEELYAYVVRFRDGLESFDHELDGDFRFQDIRVASHEYL